MSAVWTVSGSTVFETPSSRASSKLSNASTSSRCFSQASYDSLPSAIPTPDLSEVDEEDWKVYLTAKLFIKPLENR